MGTNKALKFDVVGADAGTYPRLSIPNIYSTFLGLLSYPVNTDDIAITMGERYELIVDFSEFAGKNLTLKNEIGRAHV